MQRLPLAVLTTRHRLVMIDSTHQICNAVRLQAAEQAVAEANQERDSLSTSLAELTAQVGLSSSCQMHH